MNLNEIKNIVIYNSYDENKKPLKKVTVFYEDGKVENIPYEKGVDICYAIATAKGIKSNIDFKEKIINDIVHVEETEEEFNKNYNKYIGFGRESIKDALEDILKKTEEEKENILFSSNNNKDAIKEITEEQPKKKESLLSRINEKIKKSKLGKKIAAIGLVGALMFGGYSCSQRKTKEGQMRTADLTTEVNNSKTKTKEVKSNEAQSSKKDIVKGDNSMYNNYSFSQLLAVTNNKNQKTAMENAYNALRKFNEYFANSHTQVVNDTTIKPALTFNEVMALQMAYNNYSAEEVRAIFNGTQIDANTMEKDYKSASLQLMGAYVIETPENPVDMSMLINSQEGKDFYNKYHKMFLAIKSTSGEEQLTNIKNFQAAIREDFPINEEERTEGISHRYYYDSVTEEKSSVLPMIAAYEIMYQNKVEDFTLNDIQIDFLNDVGFCNLIYDNFDKIEIITLTNTEDKTNPTYKQYKKAGIYELQKKGAYPEENYNNELTKLDEFQKIVNGNFNRNTDISLEQYYYSTGGYYTEAITNSWTEQHTEYRETEERIEKDIPEDVKQKIDQQLEKENNLPLLEKAEKEAKEVAKDLQEKEDKKAEEIQEEIKQEEKDLQDKIEDANEKIEKNQKIKQENEGKPKEEQKPINPVNESDFGDHNVIFDDEHKDAQENLNDSVENINTDSNGAKTEEDLPDPQVTGDEFDAKSTTINYNNTEITEYEEQNDITNIEQPQTETTYNDSNYITTEVYDDIEIEYSQPIYSYEEIYEEAINNYVEELANQQIIEENAYVYTK